MPVPVVLGVVAVVAPTVLMGGLAANTVAMTYGSTIANWWWNRLYRSKRLRIVFDDSHPDLYMLIMVILAMKKEEEGYNTNTRRMELPPNTMFLLSDPNCPYHGTFFKTKGKKIRKIRGHINIPIKNFLIHSDYIKKRKGHRARTRLLVCPITDGIHTYGVDIWTYQWFWGGLGKEAIGPRDAKKACDKTISSFHTFDGLDEKLEILALATGKVAPQDQADLDVIQKYVHLYRSVLNPQTRHRLPVATIQTQQPVHSSVRQPLDSSLVDEEPGTEMQQTK